MRKCNDWCLRTWSELPGCQLCVATFGADKKNVSALQCVAVCGSALQCVAVCGSVAFTWSARPGCRLCVVSFGAESGLVYCSVLQCVVA